MSHTHWPQPPNCSDSALPPLPPPIPPLPVGYKTMTVKQLEKKHKHIQKDIAAQLKELEKLKNQKAHIEVCLDYFETDEQDFMCTLQGPSTPPEEEETASMGAKSKSPSPSPPRPSFLEHMATTLLAALPTEDIWSRSDHTHRNRPIPGSYSGSTRRSEDDPLPEPFTLFGSGGTRSRPSPPHRHSPSPPPPPPAPSGGSGSGSAHNAHCLCWDCMHARGYV